MIVEYLIPIIITFLLAAALFTLIASTIMPSDAKVEIIVYSDENPDNLEYALMSAEKVAEKYFNNSTIYLKGRENDYINAVCKKYGAIRKD